MSKKVKIILALVCSFGLAGGYLYYQKQQRVQDKFHAWGHVDIRRVQLSMEESGRIKELLVEEGQRVQAGQVLAKLDTRILEIEKNRVAAQYEQAKAARRLLEAGTRSEDIQALQAQVAALSAQEKWLANEFQRQKALKQQNVTAETTYQEIKTKYETTLAQNQQAKAQLLKAQNGARPEELAQARAAEASAKAALAMMTDRIEKQAILIAPSAGTIRSRLVEVGDMVSATRTIYQLSLTEKKWVLAYLPNQRLASIQVGQKVRIDNDTPENITGTIASISPNAQFTPKNVQTEELRSMLVYEVRIAVDSSQNSLRLGQPVTIRFE